MKFSRRSSQTRLAYERLRKLLLQGRLPAGSRLGEEKWSAELSAHRGAVREALRLLAHDGLLRAGERGGFFVPEINPAAIDEVIEVRLMMELGAIQLLKLSGRVPESGIKRLHHVSDLMAQLCAERFVAGFAEADHRFHDVLVDMADNGRLSTIYRHAPLPFGQFPDLSVDELVFLMNQTIDEHRLITRHLAGRKFREASEVLQSHLLRCHSGMFRAGRAEPDGESEVFRPESTVSSTVSHSSVFAAE